MSKFFLQMLLSVMVGVSAALGFNLDSKSRLHETLQAANTFLRATSNSIAGTASDITAKINAAISVKGNTKASAANSEKMEVKVNSDLKAKGSSGDFSPGNLLPDFSLNNSFANETRTNVEADASNLDVGLKDNSKSILNIDLGQESDLPFGQSLTPFV
jgi:hypothetical protein